MSYSRWTDEHDTFNELDALMCDPVKVLMMIDGACLCRTKERRERFVRVFRAACSRKDFVGMFNGMPPRLYACWIKYYTRLATAAGVQYRVTANRAFRIKRKAMERNNAKH